MHERYQRAMHSHPRLGVYELEARGSRVRKRLSNVGDAVCDVMQSRAALGEELAHRRLWAGSAQELDLACPRVDECRLDSVLLIPRPVDELGAEGRAVQLAPLVA